MARRKKMGKAESQRRHFRKRMLERLNLVINRDDHRKIVDFIKTGKSEFICSQSKTRTVHLIVINGL